MRTTMIKRKEKEMEKLKEKMTIFNIYTLKNIINIY